MQIEIRLKDGRTVRVSLEVRVPLSSDQLRIMTDRAVKGLPVDVMLD